MARLLTGIPVDAGLHRRGWIETREGSDVDGFSDARPHFTQRAMDHPKGGYITLLWQSKYKDRDGNDMSVRTIQVSRPRAIQAMAAIAAEAEVA